MCILNRRKKYLFILGLFLLMSPGQAWSGATMYPLTKKSIHSAARYHKVPVAAMYGLLAAEGGQVGRYSSNTNGTWDLGPYQINTKWFEWDPALSDSGITPERLMNDGRLNVFVAARIFSKVLKEFPNVWQAIGAYHSRTPKYNTAYQWRVFKKLLTIEDYSPFLTNANEYVR